MMYFKSSICYNKLRLIVLFYLVFKVDVSYANDGFKDRVPALVLNSDVPHFCIQDFGKFLAIRDGSHLSPEEAWARRSEFEDWENFSLAYDEHEIWIYFSINNLSQEAQQFYLNGQLTDYIALYEIEKGEYSLLSSSGHLVPHQSRPIVDWGTIVKGTIAGKSSGSYLLKLKSITRNSRRLMGYAIPGCMRLYTEPGYHTTYKLNKHFTFFFLGIFCIIFLFNLLIFISTLRVEYLLISIYNLSTILFSFFSTNVHLETGLLGPFDWIRNVQYICTALIYLSYLLFSIKFLELKVNAPSAYKVLMVISWMFTLIVALLMLSFYEIAFQLIVVMVTVSYLTVLACTIRLSSGMVSARFLLVGNLMLSTTGIIQLLSLLNRISSRDTATLIFLVHIVELLIFSFAMAYKLRASNRILYKIRHQNELQRERLRIEEALRKELEVDVNQKARSLTATSIQLLGFNDRLTQILDKIKFDVRVGKDPSEYVVKELNDLKFFENSWDNIKTHFESVHPNFFERLERNFPHLTSNDHKLVAFLKMRLSNKEIATITNVTIRAIEQAKRRLKKKLGMETQDVDIIGHVEKADQSKMDH